jgi:sec-independent protein translocase protein TatC
MAKSNSIVKKNNKKIKNEFLFEGLSWQEKVKYITFYLREFGSYLKKIFICFLFVFFASYAFFEKIFKIFSKTIHDNKIELIYSNIFEIFFFRINFSCYLAFLSVFPLIGFYLVKFIRPGLYKKEKRILYWIFGLLVAFFYISIFICYNFAIPEIFKIILKINQQTGVKAYLKIGEYLNNFLFLSLSVGILMQIPIFLIIVLKFQLVSVRFFEKNRKVAIMVIFFLSAVFTPPDAMSQIVFGSVLWGLFEIIIFIFKKKC